MKNIGKLVWILALVLCFCGCTGFEIPEIGSATGTITENTQYGAHSLSIGPLTVASDVKYVLNAFNRLDVCGPINIEPGAIVHFRLGSQYGQADRPESYHWITSGDINIKNNSDVIFGSTESLTLAASQ